MAWKLGANCQRDWYISSREAEGSSLFTTSPPYGARPTAASRRLEYLRGFGLLLAIAVVGLFIVKWHPYFHKALALNQGGSLGPSVISGNAIAPPSPSLAAAVDYAVSYFEAIWGAMVLGMLLAATIDALLPRDWLARLLGSTSLRSSALGGLLALPGMMCTCCAAPVAITLRRSGASTGSVVAFFLGNPTVNPAVLVFLIFTLGWRWALLRLILGVALVGSTAALATRLTAGTVVRIPECKPGAAPAGREAHWLGRWFQSLARLAAGLVPEYVVIVALLGAARAFLFPVVGPEFGDELWLIVALAIAGTLFVVPTAGEIPIIHVMLAHGLGAGPAGALLLTLAPLSLPSLLMVARVFPGRVLALLTGATVVAGVASGSLALMLGL